MEEIMAILITKKLQNGHCHRTTSDHLCKRSLVIPYWWGLNHRGFVYTESHTRKNLAQVFLQIVFSSRGASWATPPLHIVRSWSHFGMCDTEGFNCLFLLFSAGSWALSFISQSVSSLFFLWCVCGGSHCKDTCACRVRVSTLCPICLISPITAWVGLEIVSPLSVSSLDLFSRYSCFMSELSPLLEHFHIRRLPGVCLEHFRPENRLQ